MPFSRIALSLGAIAIAIGAYQLSKHYRLTWLAHAQSSAPGFTARMVSYANFGQPGQKFIEEKSVTVTSDGARTETYSLPGRPLSEFAMTNMAADGQTVIAVGPIGLKTLGPKYDAAMLARSKAYKARLLAGNCVDSEKGEIFLYTETLLGRWNAVVVQPRETALGAHRVQSKSWRVPALGCQQVQFSSETFKDGSSQGTTFTQLASLDFVNTTGGSVEQQLAQLKLVPPSELFRGVTEHVGAPACEGCSRRLERMDANFDSLTK